MNARELAVSLGFSAAAAIDEIAVSDRLATLGDATERRVGALEAGALELGRLMFILYAIVVGLVVGFVLGGRLVRPRRRSSSAGRRWSLLAASSSRSSCSRGR